MDQGSLANIERLRPRLTEDGRMDLLFYRKLGETSDMLVRAASGRSAGTAQPQKQGCSSSNPTQETRTHLPAAPSSTRKKETCHVLTCHGERGGAFVSAVLVGHLAGVLATVLFDWLQNLQAGRSGAANDGALVALVDLVAIFKPGEAHPWSFLHLTFKLDSVANIYLHGDDSALEHRRPCVRGQDEKTEGVGKGKDGGAEKKERRLQSSSSSVTTFSLLLVK